MQESLSLYVVLLAAGLGTLAGALIMAIRNRIVGNRLAKKERLH